MSKILLLLLLTFCCPFLKAQTSDSASVILQNASVSILSKKISFDQPSASITEVLQKLTAEQHIRFSYADDRLPEVKSVAVRYKATPVSEVLTALLQPAGLHYLMVGRMVVIAQAKPKPAPAASSAVVSQALNAGKKLPKHLSEDPFFKRQPEEVKRKIRKLYSEELKWAKNHVARPGLKQDQDSVSHSPKKHLYELPMYLKITAGIINPKHVFKSNLVSDWQKDLQWKATYSNVFTFGARAGITYRRIWLETGFQYCRYTLQFEGISTSTYTEIDRKGNSGKISITQQTLRSAFSKSTRYSFYTIPFAALYSLPYRQFIFTAGPELQVHFIHTTSNLTPAYSNYYLQNTGSLYEEKQKKMSISAGVSAEAGYRVKQFSFSAGCHYMAGLSGYERNSLYHMRTRYFSTSLHFRYFLNTTRN